MAILSAPGVKVTVEDRSTYAESFPSLRPLIILATRKNKTTPDGLATAAGTAESGVLRQLTSGRDTLLTLGDPTFVKSAGVPVHGDETNEYGAHALWSFMQYSDRAYYIRADIDLGQLIPATTEPVGAPVDGTYWLESDTVVGGFFRRNAANSSWDSVSSSIFTTSPAGGDGAAGDIALDYSTTSGTIKFKLDSGAWVALGGADLTLSNIESRTATTDTLWVSETSPTGAGANDYWWKTIKASGGYDLQLTRYRATDSSWVAKIPSRSSVAPAGPAVDDVWEDISTLQADGNHPLKYWTGSAWAALTFVVQDTAPYTAVVDGTLWFDDTVTDFALYQEVTNVWTAIATTTNANPTSAQKVISNSAPTTPATGAIWIDTSGGNYDKFPVIKRYTGTSWEDITESVSITDTYTAASLATDGSYWLNLGDPSTRNTVKKWGSTYEPTVLDGSGNPITFNESTHGRWEPNVGANFGRKGQRKAVVTALQAAIQSNNDIRSSDVCFDMIAAPGYPELYDEMISLSTEINDTAFTVADVPSRMVPDGVPADPVITVTDWKTNANGAAATGEDGFGSSGTPYAAHYYPWALTSNTDGSDIMIPPSTVALRTIAFSDSNSYPWFAPMGNRRGIVNNASTVGYLDENGEYQTIRLTDGQQGILYDLDINPIVAFAGTGLRVWGQKTTYGVNSALDRINVARLIIKMRYDLKVSLRNFIGEPADPLTWASAKNLVEKYLAGIMSLRGISDYAVQINESNNTPERIDRNEMWVGVAIKPMKAVEFIYVPITIVDQGTNI